MKKQLSLSFFLCASFALAAGCTSVATDEPDPPEHAVLKDAEPVDEPVDEPTAEPVLADSVEVDDAMNTKPEVRYYVIADA